MKGAIIGFGNIAEHGHLPAHKKLGIDIVVAVDICPKRRELAEEYGLRAYESLDSMMQNERLDFIDICTPPNYRLEVVEFAVENGLDVICEKPICHTDEIEKMKKIVRRGDIFFFPVHNWKYSPHYQKAKELIRSNGGDLEKIHMDTLRTSFSTGTRDWNPNWRIEPDISGGGILMDHGYHNIYLAMFLFGCDFKRARLNDMEFFENSNIEKKVNCRLEFCCNGNVSCDGSVEMNLEWNSDKREIKNIFYTDHTKIELWDKKLVFNDKIYEFEHALSGDSVHGAWYVDVFADFVEKRGLKDGKYFREGIKVIEGIKELYRQSWAL
ncbi:MAG: Gfo/Idh/MocA family protein [Candidatus Hydrothermarchaeales archaeon]